ncbi:MAG: ribosomal protein S18-alanine N-acetyltransferase [Myxococcales bacterium]|nr:ribosomal protein S18-alanine N-acetyltransferase [Myxococcales bacterium]MCB9532991.1 ribosomal protein S18-alanine N-acetyltransferase [Myxococcales bacterium]
MTPAGPVAACGLRPAGTGDLDAIVAIERASQPSPWPRSLFEDELRRDVAEVTVATVDAAVVGFAVTWVVADEAHVLNVAVAPSARRRGVARSLVVRAIERANAAGAAYVMLEVRESNAAAISLYGALGFKEVGRRPRYYADNGETALVLGLMLSE